MLRDHAPKKAGFQHWPVRVADFNSHAARRLAANMIASPEAGLARPRSLASYPVATGGPLPGQPRARAYGEGKP
jgi:hypothetical protein